MVDVVHRIEHLGFIIDSVKMQVILTAEESEKILLLIHDALQEKMIIIRQVASLIGKVNATAPANPVSALFTKNLENDKIQALYVEKFNYDAYMSLSVKSTRGLSAYIAR